MVLIRCLLDVVISLSASLICDHPPLLEWEEMLTLGFPSGFRCCTANSVHTLPLLIIDYRNYRPLSEVLLLHLWVSGLQCSCGACHAGAELNCWFKSAIDHCTEDTRLFGSCNEEDGFTFLAFLALLCLLVFLTPIKERKWKSIPCSSKLQMRPVKLFWHGSVLRHVYLKMQANTRGIVVLTACDYMLHYNATHYPIWHINYMPPCWTKLKPGWMWY